MQKQNVNSPFSKLEQSTYFEQFKSNWSILFAFADFIAFLRFLISFSFLSEFQSRSLAVNFQRFASILLTRKRPKVSWLSSIECLEIFMSLFSNFDQIHRLGFIDSFWKAFEDIFWVQAFFSKVLVWCHLGLLRKQRGK